MSLEYFHIDLDQYSQTIVITIIVVIITIIIISPYCYYCCYCSLEHRHGQLQCNKIDALFSVELTENINSIFFHVIN